MSNSDKNSGAQPAGGWEGERPVFSEWMVILPIYIHFNYVNYKSPRTGDYMCRDRNNYFIGSRKYVTFRVLILVKILVGLWKSDQIIANIPLTLKTVNWDVTGRRGVGGSKCSGRPIFVFFIKENQICAMTRYHAEPNINILLKSNLPIDSGIKQWSHPSFNDTIALLVC